MVAVVALLIAGPARVAAARVRLNAITARTSQAAFAVNFPDGRWARAEFFRSAWTCSMIAWPRTRPTAATVSRSLVVKNAWNRQVSNRVACPVWGLRSGIRRTTSRPAIWLAFFCAANAVNGISAAEVAEIPFTAFAAQKKANQIPGRLVVRRIPDLNPHPGQATLFETWRFHAFFTTSTLDTVTADKTHRGHAIIEQVHADLKNSALAHLPSGKFTAAFCWRAARRPPSELSNA